MIAVERPKEAEEEWSSHSKPASAMRSQYPSLDAVDNSGERRALSLSVSGDFEL